MENAQAGRQAGRFILNRPGFGMSDHQPPWQAMVLLLHLADSSVLFFFFSSYVGCTHRSAPSIQPLWAEMTLPIVVVFFPQNF